MATVESPTRSASQRQLRARGFRLQAGAGSLAGKLLGVRGRLQLHLDPDRRHRAVLVRLPERRTGRVVDVARRRRRTDPRRAVLHGDGRAVSDRGLGLSVVQAALQRLHVVDDRLDLHRRSDRDDRRRRRRLAGRAPADHDEVPVLRLQRRRRHVPDQGRRAERAAARRDPRRDHDHDQHARRQADVAHQQRRRRCRADRLGAADHPAAVPPAPAAVGHRPHSRLRRRPPSGATSARC